MNSLPELFCWTKMGSEAGQPLGAILRRKELERLAGGGSFAWGIGNSIPSLRQAATEGGGTLPVIFSPMLAKPKPHDERPSKLVVWLGYQERGVIKPLPEHLLLTSRDAGRHYALFCHSDRSLMESCGLQLAFDDLRNAGTGAKLGFSQVTSLVRRETSPKADDGKTYKIAFVASLAGPVHAQLALGAEVPVSVAREITEASLDATAAQWAAFVAEVRSQAFQGLSEVPPNGLFK